MLAFSTATATSKPEEDVSELRRRASDGLRSLLALIVLADNSLGSHFPKSIGSLAVHGFCVLCGYAATFPPSESRRHWLLRRAWNLGFPLLVVQLLTFSLWYFDMLKSSSCMFGTNARGTNKTIKTDALGLEEVQECFSYKKGFRVIWCDDLNGALWVMEVLFLGPVLVRGVEPHRSWMMCAAAALYGLTTSRRHGSHWAAIFMGAGLPTVLPNLPHSMIKRLLITTGVAAVCVANSTLNLGGGMDSLAALGVSFIVISDPTVARWASSFATGARYSYALYIVQVPVCQAIKCRLGTGSVAVAVWLVAIPMATRLLGGPEFDATTSRILVYIDSLLGLRNTA